jgi:hypothetical protein
VPCRKRKSKVRDPNWASLPFSGEGQYLRISTTTPGYDACP